MELFLGAAALVTSSLSRPNAEGSSLEENFLLGTLLFPASTRSLIGSSLGKDVFLLGRLPLLPVS